MLTSFISGENKSGWDYSGKAEGAVKAGRMRRFRSDEGRDKSGINCNPGKGSRQLVMGR